MKLDEATLWHLTFTIPWVSSPFQSQGRTWSCYATANSRPCRLRCSFFEPSMISSNAARLHLEMSDLRNWIQDSQGGGTKWYCFTNENACISKLDLTIELGLLFWNRGPIEREIQPIKSLQLYYEPIISRLEVRETPIRST